MGGLVAAGAKRSFDKDIVLAIVRIMAKVTSKLQVTVPKTIAEHYGIRPGDTLEWIPAGDVIRVVPPGRRPMRKEARERVRLFDLATERQRRRQKRIPKAKEPASRGWRREELYVRGSTG